MIKVIRTIKTVPCFNPRLKDFLVVGTEEPKTYLIPEREFTNLVIEAGRRFDTIAPLAPYPNIIGCEWKTNNTVYKWFVKKLKEIQKKYDHLLGE